MGYLYVKLQVLLFRLVHFQDNFFDGFGNVYKNRHIVSVG